MEPIHTSNIWNDEDQEDYAKHFEKKVFFGKRVDKIRLY